MKKTWILVVIIDIKLHYQKCKYVNGFCCRTVQFSTSKGKHIEFNQDATTYSEGTMPCSSSKTDPKTIESPCLQEDISFELKTLSAESSSYECIVQVPQHSSTLKNSQASENRSYDNA